MIPLYAEHDHDRLDIRPPQGHAGLWFERFFNRYSDGWKVEDTAKRDFLHSLLGHHSSVDGQVGNTGCVGYSGVLDRHAEQLAELAEGLQGGTFAMQSSWHFATGLGNPHPVENGLSWHPVLGTPYLPGSAVKGLARAWLELNDYSPEVRKRMFGSDHKDPAQASSFHGEPELIGGEVIFFDALPLEPVILTVDTMTPHMGKWYEQGATRPATAETTPADWHAPTPVPFLVAKQIVLQFAVAPRNPDAAPLADVARQALRAALENLGAGAKTSAGYGAFVELDEERLRKQEKRRVERERVEEERAAQSALASLSAEARLLVEFRQLAEVPANREPGSGADFHNRLQVVLEDAEQWSQEEASELALFAREFFKAYGSKNRLKAVKPQIRKLLGEE
ncbi:type III-B CRISPR module RAMP protein Cmr6 [Halomonas sp.]|uniref:type III-B CRISPR module RAMP protein Cmr6 n=1 Tax=Halomonas sp. TaxID=1486246 RepID=UPI00384DB525